jgi:hypothetical protein
VEAELDVPDVPAKAKSPEAVLLWGESAHPATAKYLGAVLLVQSDAPDVPVRARFRVEARQGQLDE